MHNWYNWLLFLVFAASFIYTLSRLRVYFCLSYHRKDKDDRLDLRTTILGGLIAYEMHIPVMQVTNRQGIPWVETEVETGWGERETHAAAEQAYAGWNFIYYFKRPEEISRLFASMRQYAEKYHAFMDKLSPSLRCEVLRWRTIVATDDAAVTGVVTGLLWVLMAIWLTQLCRRLRFIYPPVVTVEADFQSRQWGTDFCCIFSVTVGNIINAVIVLLHNGAKQRRKQGI